MRMIYPERLQMTQPTCGGALTAMSRLVIKSLQTNTRYEADADKVQQD